MSDFYVVIPSRYQSVRLPGKPLRDILGKPMVQYVCESAANSGAREVIVATDDERIRETVESFGTKVCMTRDDHTSGTERIAEVAEIEGWADDAIVVNLQGDEPTMPSALVDECAALLAGSNAEIATLASPFESVEEFQNPNAVKVIRNQHGNAIYFSRAAIPYARNGDASEAMTQSLLHHGIYAYRVKALKAFVAAEPTKIEYTESLEQLRALSMGMRIAVGIPSVKPGSGVDTEDDLAAAERALSR